MQLKVLYLDDESDLCEIFEAQFTTDTVKIRAFTDPKRAIEEALKSPPDIIFLDYRMPGTTGDEVAQAMPAAVPKYLISGDVLIKTAYGFKAVFEKPINPESIRRILKTLMDAKSAA